MGAAIASTVVWRRDAIECVPKFAGAELPVRRRAVSQPDDARGNDSAAKRQRLLRRQIALPILVGILKIVRIKLWLRFVKHRKYGVLL